MNIAILTAIALVLGPLVTYGLELTRLAPARSANLKLQLASRVYAVWCDVFAFGIVWLYGRQELPFVIPVFLVGQAAVWTTIWISLIPLGGAGSPTVGDAPMFDTALTQSAIGLSLISFAVALGTRHSFSVDLLLLGGIALSVVSLVIGNRIRSHFTTLAILAANLLSVFTLYVCASVAKNLGVMLISGLCVVFTVVWVATFNFRFRTATALRSADDPKATGST